MTRPNILVAEDEGALVTLLRYNLEREGYRVLEARDGEEALLVAAEEKPDLVLLDLKLSKAGDGELLKELKRDPLLKRIPVVVLASSVSYEEIYEAYDLHANAYICKPAKRKD